MLQEGLGAVTASGHDQLGMGVGKWAAVLMAVEEAWLGRRGLACCCCCW